MRVRILDLDGSLTSQHRLFDGRTTYHDLRTWGRRIRLACRFRRFRKCERALTNLLGEPCDNEPWITLYGSGDFHHFSLALLRRMQEPCNLLILDKHPDWMRGVPLLHCGTWVAHALRLPCIRRVFHLGGDLDFDNAFRWLAPWKALRSKQVVVMPAIRRFSRGAWARIDHDTLRPMSWLPLVQERLRELLAPYHEDLARLPLYISLDKDVLRAEDATVNWDSGHLNLSEVQAILSTFLALCRRPCGMDVVGDWSPIDVQGGLRHLLHRIEHEPMQVDPVDAAGRNEATNLAILETVRATLAARPSLQRSEDAINCNRRSSSSAWSIAS
jgi:hypothetical protein